MSKFVIVKSDNFDDVIMTIKAYNIVRLEMSTGDYGNHIVKSVDLSRSTLKRRGYKIFTVAHALGHKDFNEDRYDASQLGNVLDLSGED